MSLLANHGQPWRWRGGDIFGGGGEDILVECWRSLEKLMVEGKGSLWWKKKERKKMGKGKEIGKVRYFLGRENENNESGGFPRFGCGCGKLSEKYRNRPEIKYLGTTRKNSQKSRIL